MKQNGVTDDALRLYLFPYSLTHHATAWRDLRVRCLSTPYLTLERKSKQLPHGMVLTKSTTRVPPLEVQPSPASRPSELPPAPTLSSVIPGRNPHQPPIPYPSRLNKEKLQDKSDIQIHKFLQMFKKLHFNISLAEALALMPKYHKMLKDLLSDKEKLLGLENTPLTKNCLALLLKKLPKKLRDLGKFLIPCDFPMVEICMALADLGASINLMVLSIWKKCCIDEDVFIQVGKFTFLADFVVVNYDVNPRFPLILGRPFLRTARALVDDEIPRDLPPKELKDDDLKMTKSLIEKPSRIDNEIFDAERDILLEKLLNIDSTKDFPPLELNNDPEEDILFLENLLKDEPSETERSEIYTLIGEPPDIFLMRDKEIKFNPLKDIDDPVPILRLNSEYTLNYDNPIFDIQNENSDASKTDTIMDEVQIDSLQSIAHVPPLFEALIPDMTMHDIILYQILHGMVHSSRLSFYFGLLFPKGVSESHSLDSFELGDENLVFDPGAIVIKGWIEHYHGGDIPASDVPDICFFPMDKGASPASDSLINKLL
ncbi:hypothetical protein Tco_0475414 [Tanacetum coccineum]